MKVSVSRSQFTKIIATLSFALFAFYTSAQTPAPAPSKGNGKISGVIIDSLTSKPVEFANVALIDLATKKTVDGAMCDLNGKFALTKIAKGNYQVVISFVNFTSKTVNANLTVKSDVDLGSISLSGKTLQEVTIQGQKTLVEEKIDRMVYNAENDVTTKGGDASDVLKRVPLLAVDIDGNVALRGSTNVLVLINNKPSTITASSVANALKKIPADHIKNVEVITSPSSKYDAEGSAGIINIVLKKNTLQGVFFNLDATAGNRGSSLNLNANFRKKKMGFALGGFSRATYNVISSFENDQTTMNKGDTIQNIQSANNTSNGTSNQYTFGWDYDINKNNVLTASVRYGEQNQNSYQNQLLTQSYTSEGSLIQQNLKDVKNTNVSNSIDASLAYTKLFAKKDRELSFLSIFSRNSPTVGFVTNTVDPIKGDIINSYKNVNEGYTQEMSAQLDMKEPIAEGHTLEYGVKNIWRDVSTDYQYYIADGPGEEYHVSTNPNLTNGFRYNQNISSGYLSYTLAAFKGYTFRAGSRYEYTIINAFYEGQPDFNIPSYGVLVPSFNLSKKLKNGNLIKLAYSRRIQRPSLRDLNPNIQASNPLNASMGNPNLKPEYTGNYEIAYNTLIKKATFNISTYVRYNTNDIQQARTIKGDTIIAVAQNIGTEANYGMSVFVSVPFSNKFSLSGSTDLMYRILKNNSNDPSINASNRGFTPNFRLTGNYNFAPGWAMQFFGSYQGKNFNLQGYRTGVVSQSLSVKKDIWKKAGALSFAIDNFMTPSFNVYAVLNSAYIDQSTTTVLHNFMARISFSYKIGKLKVQEKRQNLGGEDN
jgi:outer membrane receptor protein involved in Fe transport